MAYTARHLPHQTAETRPSSKEQKYAAEVFAASGPPPRPTTTAATTTTATAGGWLSTNAVPVARLTLAPNCTATAAAHNMPPGSFCTASTSTSTEAASPQLMLYYHPGHPSATVASVQLETTVVVELAGTQDVTLRNFDLVGPASRLVDIYGGGGVVVANCTMRWASFSAIAANFKSKAGISNLLATFPLCEVLSVPRCVLPCECRKMLRMVWKLMELCEMTWSRRRGAGSQHRGQHHYRVGVRAVHREPSALV